MRLKIRKPDDMHVHLRTGDMLQVVTKYTAGHFGRALVMPNVPAIYTGRDVEQYRREILDARPDFEPLMSIALTPHTTAETISDAHAAGAVAVKVYPLNEQREAVTTSGGGKHAGVTVADLLRLDPAVFREMQALGMLLLWHGEYPGPDALRAEDRMLPVIGRFVDDYPRLRIVLEHVSTRRGVQWVERCPDTVAATITVHHLYLTHDDLIGRGDYGRAGKLHPHYFYQPIAKTTDDREALLQAATSGNPKFFLGTDSAPHSLDAKFDEDLGCCAAGVFSAPVALAALASKFDEYHALDLLEDFVSTFGAIFYGLDPNCDWLELERRAWTVPTRIVERDVVLTPFLAGHELPWMVVDQ